MKEDQLNPYAAPQATTVTNEAMPSHAESLRRRHINHEASVKFVGFLYVAGSVVWLIAAVVIFVSGRKLSGDVAIGASEFLTFALVGTLLVYIFATGIGLRKLSWWGRVLATISSFIGLAGFPIGTIFSLYTLYLLYSIKGQTIFTEEYRETVSQTPHVKYRRSGAAWLFLLILVSIFIALFAYMSSLHATHSAP